MNMKNVIVFISMLSYSLICAQQDSAIERYRLRMKINSQDTVFMKIKEVKTVLKKGWTVLESKDEVKIERTLLDDTIIITKVYTPIKVTSNWKIGEVKHTDESPGKLFLNPYHFSSEKDSLLNNESYIKIPENGFVTLKKTTIKFNPMTIPFAIRPAINDTIGSKITTDLKVGASFSYNLNWEKFKNRRLSAKKSVYGVLCGIGFGFSKVTLNASSTSLNSTPYKIEEDGLAFFVTPGIGLNMNGFQLYFTYGVDIPITDNTKDWNYANKGYFGIGLGVGLDVFGLGK